MSSVNGTIMVKNNRFSFDDLYFFYKAAEIGSYSLAAKFFSVNSTTVSRRIIALEDSLKVKLVEVSNNSFSLTIKASRFLICWLAVNLVLINYNFL